MQKTKNGEASSVVVNIPLTVVDGWPPVGVEGLPCTVVKLGYRVENPPLFVRDLSAGDVIAVNRDDLGDVVSWETRERSRHTTVWLLRKKTPNNIDEVLCALRSLHCNTVRLPEYGCYSIDVPAECDISQVDKRLSLLNEEEVAIAFPSFRHDE
jgi:Domain of unknown function (DUF4265)